jgi:hypothetical protein
MKKSHPKKLLLRPCAVLALILVLVSCGVDRHVSDWVTHNPNHRTKIVTFIVKMEHKQSSSSPTSTLDNTNQHTRKRRLTASPSKDESIQIDNHRINGNAQFDDVNGQAATVARVISTNSHHHDDAQKRRKSGDAFPPSTSSPPSSSSSSSSRRNTVDDGNANDSKRSSMPSLSLTSSTASTPISTTASVEEKADIELPSDSMFVAFMWH